MDPTKLRFVPDSPKKTQLRVYYGEVMLGYIERAEDSFFHKEQTGTWCMVFGGCGITRNTDGRNEPTKELAAEVLYERMIEKLKWRVADVGEDVAALMKLDAGNDALDALDSLVEIVSVMGR